MRKKHLGVIGRLLLLAWLAAGLAACDRIPPLGAMLEQLQGAATPSASFTSQPATPVSLPTRPAITGSPPPATPNRPEMLRVWLPPQFDPQASTPGGDLLRARLDEFARLADVQIETRVKSVDGPGGMLDSLSGASAAAPLALPDLVALPRPLLETAALKGLLYPLDAMTGAMESEDWYDWARQLARVQSSTFGLPFAGDALVLMHRPSMVNAPPPDWQTTLDKGVSLAFAAADPQALFTLALYRAAGGDIQDEQGRPALERDPLVQVFSFYQQASQAEILPIELSQYATEDQVWDEVVDGRFSMGAVWSAHYLSGAITDTAIAPLPTRDGVPFTWVTGWVWAVASPQPAQRALGVQLAEFLAESDFLLDWSLAARILPPRPSVMEGMQEEAPQTQFAAILPAAQVYPSADVLASLGPPLQEAVLSILERQDAQTAAQAAMDRLNGP